MSRKVLSRASGVSERYLAELERGAGNASLLVLRQIAQALSIEAAALVSDEPERPLDLTLAMHQLQRLSPGELAEARELIAQRFGKAAARAHGRIALVGLRGAGKTTLGQLAAEALAVPFIELDREIERACGMELSEIFATHGPGDVPPARAAVPADRRAALRARGDRHRRQPGHGAGDVRSAAVDLLRRLAQGHARPAHGPRDRPGRPAPDGRQSAGHGRSAEPSWRAAPRSMPKPAPR